MSIFKTKGFDTLIGKNTVITGALVLHGVTVVDGLFEGDSICSDQSSADKKRDALVVNGTVNVRSVVVSHDLTITGAVTAKEIRVEGTLAIKSGSQVRADSIFYRTLVAEPGAVILGAMKHMDHYKEADSGPPAD